MSNADKRNCVERMVKLEPEWADNRIAEHVRLAHTFVADVRLQLVSDTSATWT